MKISLGELTHENKSDYIVSHFIKKEQQTDFSIVFVECITGHYKTKLKHAKRIYFILEGSGNFIIDETSYDAKQYDLFIIESMSIYEYKGKMKMIEFNVPATIVTGKQIGRAHV